jgi:hypothetical protein
MDDTYMGEFFLNFVLRLILQELAGVDLSLYHGPTTSNCDSIIQMGIAVSLSSSSSSFVVAIIVLTCCQSERDWPFLQQKLCNVNTPKLLERYFPPKVGNNGYQLFLQLLQQGGSQ